MSDLRFSRVVGSLAGSLAYGEGTAGQEWDTEYDSNPHDMDSSSKETEVELATGHDDTNHVSDSHKLELDPGEDVERYINRDQ